MQEPGGHDNPVGGSELCLSCGLCCNGALHSGVTIAAEDAPSVRDLGLTITAISGGDCGFRLPCPLHQNDRCSVHPNHPRTCRDYRCALRQKYDAGAVTLASSLAIVRSAKALLAATAAPATTDAEAARESVYERLARSWDAETGLSGTGAQRDANADVLLSVVALDVHLRRYFRPVAK
jgi:Fe-S-cluster containining protein